MNRLQQWWKKWHQPHNWSSIITIPSKEYQTGNVTIHQMGIQFYVCQQCGITDATAHYWRYCRPWRKNFLNK